jgi:plasmid maintenance system antidote protein VapI
MSMYNPPHPGEFIKEVYLDPFHFSFRSVAAKLKVSPSMVLQNAGDSCTPRFVK